MQIGQYNDCVVESLMPQGFYLLPTDGGRVLLPTSKAPIGLKPQDSIRGFVYLDSEDRPVATTQNPHAMVGDFAVLEVKEVNDFGAFLDWGIDKDLLLPYRNQLGEVRPGDRCVVYVLEDSVSGRIVATEKTRPFIDYDTSALHPGMKVDLIAYDFHPEWIDFLVNKQYTGRLHGDPSLRHLHIGDSIVGYIQNIREDAKVDISLNPVGYRAVMDTADSFLSYLKQEGGFVRLGDHSDPAEIQATLGISKKAFKKLIGGLFRQGIIELSDQGIRLK